MSTFSGFGHHRQRRNQSNLDNQFNNNEDNESRRNYGTRQPENNGSSQNNQLLARTSRHVGQHRDTINPIYGTDRDNELERLERLIQEGRAEHLQHTREALECARRHSEYRDWSSTYLILLGISTGIQEEERMVQDAQRMERLLWDLRDMETGTYWTSRAREGRLMVNSAQSDVHLERFRARASQHRALNAAAVGRRSPTPPPPYQEARSPPPTYDEAIASGRNRRILVSADHLQQQLATAAMPTRIQEFRVATVNRQARHTAGRSVDRSSGRLSTILSTENQQSRTIVGRVAGEDEQASYRERSFSRHGPSYGARHDSMGDRDRSRSPRTRHTPGRLPVGARSNRPAPLDNDSSRTRESSSYLQADPGSGGPRSYRSSAQQDYQAQQPAARPSSLPMMGQYAVTEHYATLPDSSNGTPFRRGQRQVPNARPNRTPLQPQVNFARDTDGDLPMGDADDDDWAQSRRHIGR